MSDTKQYHYGTGRRKTAIAQVRLYPKGSGKVTINETVVATPSSVYLEPLKMVGLQDMDISAHVQGGGFQGQIEAIRHGVSRALLEADAELRSTLKKAGFLTRDPRAKERKKFGLKGARRAPQWSKR